MGAVKHILVCGRGLAFEMGLAALANNLPNSVKITALELTNQTDHDAFYGNVTTPLAYEFHEKLGINEAGLLQQTNTTFSFGTQYTNWANKHNWTQAHHLPFPIWNSVQFHQYLRRFDEPLEPYLVSAIAGQNGGFAHPPTDPNIPLSRAEYGYQFQPETFVNYLKQQAQPNKVSRINGEIKSVETKRRTIVFVDLKDGTRISADLFIDASGVSGDLISTFGTEHSVARRLEVMESTARSDDLPGSLRTVQGQDYGWTSTSHLQNQKCILTVSHPDVLATAKLKQEGQTHNSFNIGVGGRNRGWVGNCVGIGHANCVLEPLTPAPIMLLQRDILRLLELIPVTKDMSLEESEYNRLLADDVEHCTLFNDTFFHIPENIRTPYWKDAVSETQSDKFARKYTQFKSRGQITMFDYEPFNEQDWTILYFGLHLAPERYDLFADNMSETAIRNQLDQLKQSIEQIAQRIPPHKRYLDKFLDYLERKNVR